MSLPRHSSAFAIPLLALPLSCTGDDANDDIADDETTGETETGDGDGDGGPCTAPGTTVPGVEPFVPSASDPAPTCSTGWASEAPLVEANWVVMMPSVGYYYYGIPVVVQALSGGAALVVADTSLQWFDGAGRSTGEVSHGFGGVSPHTVALRAADEHIFIVGPDEMGDDLLIKEFADGAMVGEIAVVTPGTNSQPVGLFPFSTDEWLIVGDEFDEMEGDDEAFFMRVDAAGTELVRKATALPYCYYCNSSVQFGALDDDEDVLFGTTSQQWILDPNDGAVTNPAVGLSALRDIVGSATGAGFAMATVQASNNSDGGVSGLSGVGANLWTQAYDRAQTSDNFFAVAAAEDGGWVVGGADGIWWEPAQGSQSSQPLVIGMDADGNAEWLGRLAIPGDTRGVSVAPDGGVIAAGGSTMDGESSIWIASW